MLVALLGLSLNRNRNVEVVTECVIDTLLTIKTDTLKLKDTVYVQKKVIDTVFIDVNNQTSLSLPIEQKLYSKEGVYNAWVSGYNAKLDSIYTFPRTEYKTITQETTKKVEYSRWGAYPFMGLKSFKGGFEPSVGIAVKSPKKWLYMVEVGLDDNRNVFYGFNIGYNIQ